MRPADKLVMMANQIARNLAVQGADKAPALTADHIRASGTRGCAPRSSPTSRPAARSSPTARAAVLLLADPRAKAGPAS